MSNFWKKLFSSILGTKSSRPKYEYSSTRSKYPITISPKHLPACRDWHVKNWHKYKHIYSYQQVFDYGRKTLVKINGRRVKYWKLIYSTDDIEGDDYIPIFFKKKKHITLHPQR